MLELANAFECALCIILKTNTRNDKIAMKIKRINHIGIVSKNSQDCTNFFQNILGIDLIGQEHVHDQKVDVDMLLVEQSRIEILRPTADDSPISNFLATKGSGIHHVALEVENIEESLAELKAKNIKLIDQVPRDGAHHTKIAFIHPHATGGILVELVQALN